MKSVQQIYSNYRIMPTLELHQLRVAAVAKTIAENFKEKVDVQSIVLACLFHDMGNIIKSDLSRFPEFLQPHGLEYWQKVKNDYKEKYGGEEHVATEAIAREIGLPHEAMECLRHIGFSHATENEAGASYENKICNYADMRIGPYGVLPMAERIAEGRKRYEGRKHVIASDLFEVHTKSLISIEKQIFAQTTIRPDDITDAAIASVVEDLRKTRF